MGVPQLTTEVCQWLFTGPCDEDTGRFAEALKPFAPLLSAVMSRAEEHIHATTSHDVLDAVLAYAKSEPSKGTMRMLVR